MKDDDSSPNDNLENDTLKMVKSISWLSSGLVSLLALASFTLSFEALRSLAIETGVVVPSLGWIFPLIVDGAIVVFSLCALRASLRKEKTRWLRALVIFSTIGSVVFNMAHVETKWLAMVLAATPPVLLFLSFEALMHSVQAEMERVMDSKELPKTGNGLEKKKLTRPKISLRGKSTKKSDRLAKVKALKDQGMTPPQIAKKLEHVSLRTVQRDLKELALK